MEVFQLKEDIHAMGFQVKSFPDGIGDAFNTLLNKIDGGLNRAYYGISYMTPAHEILYNAAAEVLNPREPEQYDLQRYIISKGNYRAVALRDWRKNLHMIKEIFTEINCDSLTAGSPCIEWYKDEEEMICMVKLNG
jgi:hypothetical protein